MTPNQTQIRDAHEKVLFLGLALNLLLPAVVLAAGFLVRQVVFGGGALVVDDPSRVMFYVLLFVAASEIAVALFLKKIMLKPLPVTGEPADNVPTTTFVVSRYLVVFNLAAACSIYGFVWFMLGGTVAEFVLFAVIGLIIFRLVRPSKEFFYSLFGVRPAIE